jgi:pimeloyl-ACP methyl ester carboxylesterase
MKPFFFGSSRRALFGLYQPAEGAPARDVGVLLCNPFGHEAVRAHRALRQLGVMLARARYHVLRFDYSSTGDSAGDGTDARVAEWLDDVQTAADELRDMAGVTRLACVGLRLGATLATQAARQRRDVEQLVLWDPVVRGASYLGELCRAHVDFLRAENPSARARAAELDAVLARGGAALEEALGFPLPAALRSDIAELEIDGEAPARKVTMVASRDDADLDRLLARWGRSRAAVTYDHVPRGALWNSDEAVDSALVPIEALKAIVARMT